MISITDRDSQQVSAAVCSFPDVRSAVESVICILQHDVPIARIELMDALSMMIARKYSKIDLPENPALFLEFHASGQAEVERISQVVRDIVADHSATSFESSSDRETRSRLWKARHDMLYATRAMFPGMKGLVTDVCVPISRLTDMIAGAQQIMKQHDVMGIDSYDS